MKISSALLIMITVLMCGLLFSTINSGFGSAFGSSYSVPAKIEIVKFAGGDRYNDSVRFQDNVLILNHAGGSPLPMESI